MKCREKLNSNLNQIFIEKLEKLGFVSVLGLVSESMEGFRMYQKVSESIGMCFFVFAYRKLNLCLIFALTLNRGFPILCN